MALQVYRNEVSVITFRGTFLVKFQTEKGQLILLLLKELSLEMLSDGHSSPCSKICLKELGAYR